MTDKRVNTDNRITGPEECVHDIVLVPEPSQEYLNQRQCVDYHDHREKLCQWMVNLGKDPQSGEGYAFATSRRRAHQLDRFYRFVWDEHGGYTTQITHEQANEFMRALAYEEHSQTHKANAQKTLKMYFRWRTDSNTWDPEINFTTDDTRSRPREFFTKTERAALREAALEYGSVPSYGNCTPSERREWITYLSQRFRKPADEIGPNDFKRANGFKIPSLVWISLDCGLRPVEVGKATTQWIDTDNMVLRIPADQSAKNREHWQPAIQERTARMVERWLDERKLYNKYEQTDTLWLTREGNPYSSSSLGHLLNRLCDEADIDTENRQISWYAIRHSTGTAMTREAGIEAAAEQLRHQSPSTTRKYDNAPADDRRDALNDMG